LKKNPLGDETQRIVSAFIDHHRYATLGSLVKGIIHNLNGSLQILLMHMELLDRMLEAKEKNPDQVHNKMEQCLRQVDKLKSIIEGLAVKAKHDEEDSPQVFNVNHLLEECLSLLHHNLFFKHNIKVKKVLSPRLPPLKGYYIDFHEGFLNLINNAIEAMEETPKRELTLVTKTDKSQVEVSIGDTGCGIGDQVKPYLFTPFFSTKGGKHNGLGLFIARELLTPYGASFSHTSGKGETIFSVTLPLKPLLSPSVKS
jgi:two-component system, NtrC family, sensor kinase